MKAIMYHYVRSDDPSFPHFRHMPVETFERQLDFFAREYRLITRAEFERALETCTPIEKGIVLTFDDAMKDHFDPVFRILRDRGLFGIFYIPAYPYLTGKILDVHRTHLLLGRFGGQAIWEALLQQLSPDLLSHAHVGEFQRQTYRNQTNDDFTNQVKRTLNYFIDYRFRTKIVDSLMAEFFPDEEEIARSFYVSKSDLQEMHEGGMILGSHTVNHPCLSKLSLSEQKDEIEKSFDFLQSVIGPAQPKTFCYPYGGFHSFTSETENLLEAAGCRFAFNVEQRGISSDDLRLRRQALPRYECNLFPPVKRN